MEKGKAMDDNLAALLQSYELRPGDEDGVDLPTFPDSPDCLDLLSDDALDTADLLNLDDPDPFVSGSEKASGRVNLKLM